MKIKEALEKGLLVKQQIEDDIWIVEKKNGEKVVGIEGDEVDDIEVSINDVGEVTGVFL